MKILIKIILNILLTVNFTMYILNRDYYFLLLFNIYESYSRVQRKDSNAQYTYMYISQFCMHAMYHGNTYMINIMRCLDHDIDKNINYLHPQKFIQI